ncbi:MAG TPA: ERCC4 domain-containing protein [archaeon]|nr:ERCC4 domain-containing protein [archaeon]
MDTQKVLKTDKLSVMADYREKETISELKSLGISVNETSLEIGDFICSNGRVVIERKAHDDFIASIIDGRLFEQSRIMKENFERPVVLIEGYSNRNMNENALKAAIASIVVNYGVSLINTKSPNDTAKTIYWIAKKEQEENKNMLSFKVGKKPKDDKLLQEFILSSIPGVSKKTAEKLLQKFGSIKEVLASEKMELEKIIGKSKSEKMFNLLNKKYVR